jgi:uncharacterized protein (DUF58 family)
MTTLHPPSVQAAAAPRGRFAFGLTPLALVLLFAGALWVIPAFFSTWFLLALAVWDLLVLLLAALDGMRLPAARAIKVERSWLSIPAIGEPCEVELSLRHTAGFPLWAKVIDDLPAELNTFPKTFALTAWPGEASTLRYRFLPAARGDSAAGGVYVRYRSRAGLAERWALAPLQQTVRVYPSLRSGEEDDLFLARSRQNELQKRRERLRGQGREFESLREYREGGDDLREVSWTATARRGVLICRQYQVERSQPVWLVMDSGRLLQARSGMYSRLDGNTGAALAVAQLALLAGDRVGMLGYGGAIQQKVAPKRGKSHFRSLMDAAALLQAEPGEAGHLLAAAQLARMQPTRSLILWFTDLTEAAMRPEVIDGAVQLMRRHLLLFIVPAPEEMLALVASTPENAAQMFERTAAQEMLQRREVLLAGLRSRGALTLQTPSAKLSASVLNRYLAIKEGSLL